MTESKDLIEILLRLEYLTKIVENQSQIPIETITGIFGVILGSVLSFLFSGWNLKRQLKREKEIKTQEELISEKKKWYFEALHVVENHVLFSIKNNDPLYKNSIIVDVQDTLKARHVLDKLIIYCKNQEIIKLYKDSLWGKTQNGVKAIDDFRKQMMIDLKLLNKGEEYIHDDVFTTISALPGDPMADVGKVKTQFHE